MHLLGCLFFFVFGIFFIFLALFGNVIKALFKLRKATKNFKQKQTSQNYQQPQYEKTERGGKHKHHKKDEKIFPKEVGEYVEFEEVK